MGNMKPIIPFLVSIVIAVTGTWVIYQWVQKQRAPKEVVQVQQTEAIPVVVASTDIPWGTKLQPEMIKMLPFLKESLPTGHFCNSNDLKDRVLVESLKANDPVTEHKLAPVSVQTGGIACILPSGKRAVSVKGDKVIGVAGLVNPGNRVDVLVTVDGSKDSGKESKTKLVLEKIHVLATGTQVQKNEKGEPAPVDVYTLEVTPEESEKLALAATEGKIQLSLRSITDMESVYTEGMDIPKLLASLSLTKYRPEPPKNKPAEPGTAPVKKWIPKPSASIEVIKGIEVSRINFTQ
ncbi:MAG: Flp pilus assembly protein CpaB [Deltaproteobacteria bacterium]|nr:Flp pilus assembly protein CpaB [Deltaproteobacteria bacterium]